MIEVDKVDEVKKHLDHACPELSRRVEYLVHLDHLFVLRNPHSSLNILTITYNFAPVGFPRSRG